MHRLFIVCFDLNLNMNSPLTIVDFKNILTIFVLVAVEFAARLVYCYDFGCRSIDVIANFSMCCVFHCHFFDVCCLLSATFFCIGGMVFEIRLLCVCLWVFL